jgi:hypothetical protein
MNIKISKEDSDYMYNLIQKIVDEIYSLKSIISNTFFIRNRAQIDAILRKVIC